MPQQTVEQVVEGQREDWNRVAGGWEKWDRFFDQQTAFLNHRVVADAHITPGMRVLDLGSGTGYPALLAAHIVGQTGTVIGVDVAERMLAIAERKAAGLGLSNTRFQRGDITALSFESASFDAVTSRFCLMFLPDIPAAVSEIARVLRPGGWIAAAVWSAPEKNVSFSVTLNVLKQFIDIPPPDPTMPGIFRLAKPGELAGFFQRAGLTDPMEQEFPAEWSYASPEEYYTSMMDLAAPIQNLMARLSADQREQARRLIIEAAATFQRRGRVTVPIVVRLVAARKPV
jgi:ubiquinone/menaquinone biosynthesis C-methylase UbiE